MTLGNVKLLKFDQSEELLSLIKTPKSVPIYKVSELLFSSKTIVFTGIFGSVPGIIYQLLPPSSDLYTF